MYLQSIKSAAKSVKWSILKKSRHIGFGVFIVHSSMEHMFGVSSTHFLGLLSELTVKYKNNQLPVLLFSVFTLRSRIISFLLPPVVACVPAVAAVTLLLSSLLLLVYGVTAISCIPAVAGFSAIAGVPLFPDVLTVAGLHCIAGIPCIVRFYAVACVPDVVGVYAIASVRVDPGVPILAGVLTDCTVQRGI
jgi:hypothetical protein